MNGRRARGRRPSAVVAATCLACALPALASMDEAWVRRATVSPGTRPLLVLLDHAGGDAARAVAPPPPYDPAFDYAARITAGPACAPARVYWRRGPGPAPDCLGGPSLPMDGAGAGGFRCEAGRAALARHGVFVASRAAQWQAARGGGFWRELEAGSEGPVECRADRGRHGASDGEHYAADGTAGPWSGDPASEIAWDAAPHSDAYVFFTGNYLNYLATAVPGPQMTLAEAFAHAARIAAATTEGLDLALARLPASGAALELALAPTALPAPDAVAAALAAGVGTAAPPADGVAALAGWLARDPRAFRHACRAASAALIAAGAGDGCTDGGCLLAPIAALTAPDLVPTTPGDQRVRAWIVTDTTQGADLAGAARATGTPLLDLSDPLALTMLFAQALQRDAAPPAAARFSAAALPSAGVRGHAPVLFEGVGRPQATRRWPGTLRRRDLAGDGRAPTWDAAERLPSPAERKLLTDLLTNRLASPSGSLVSAFGNLPASALGLSAHDAISAADLLSWLRGADALDEDADGDRVEAKGELGEPGGDAPVIVRYAGASPQSLVYAVSGDGLVHAFDADTGEEQWAFFPSVNLPFLRSLADPSETRVRLPRGSGLRIQRTDLDGDGAIDAAAGEQVRLFLGLGAGARGYLALDVSEPSKPVVAWLLGPAELPGLGETLVAPVPARMRVDDERQRGDPRVVALSWGYDPGQRARAASADAVGGRLALVSARSGAVLWQAAAEAGPGVDVTHPELTASFAAPPRAVDGNGDGLAERLYALDVVGRLWRFDVGATGSSVRLIARLGASARPEDARDARRFHAAPDVIPLRDARGVRLALAFGSGWAERPMSAGVEDRFYVVFDDVGAGDTDTAPPPLSEDDLTDVTEGAPPPAGARGWFLRLDRHGPGEKTWGASVALDGRLRFTTWQPRPPDPAEPCGPPRGTARLYTLAVATGSGFGVVDDLAERSVELADETPPPPLRLALPTAAGEACAWPCRAAPQVLLGERVLPTGFGNDPVKTSWRRLETED